MQLRNFKDSGHCNSMIDRLFSVRKKEVVEDIGESLNRNNLKICARSLFAATILTKINNIIFKRGRGRWGECETSPTGDSKKKGDTGI